MRQVVTSTSCDVSDQALPLLSNFSCVCITFAGEGIQGVRIYIRYVEAGAFEPLEAAMSVQLLGTELGLHT